MLLLNLSNFGVSNINSRENLAARSQLAATQAHPEASHQLNAVPRQRRALAGKSGIKIFPMNQMNEPRLTSLSHGGGYG
jgi:hypothetical protein